MKAFILFILFLVEFTTFILFLFFDDTIQWVPVCFTGTLTVASLFLLYYECRMKEDSSYEDHKGFPNETN